MTNNQQTSKTLHILLWITQLVLATTFIWAAYMKLSQSPEELANMWPWTARNQVLVKTTGILDMLAGIGLIFPSLFRFQPNLTIYAAYGALGLMIAASGFHIVRGEVSQIGINIVFGVLAGFVAWGRSKRVPIVTRK